VTPTSAAAPEGIGLPAFNALPDGQARELLLGCCHAGRWAAAVAGGRPYPTLGALLARAGEELADGDVAEALAGHPRIGAAPGAGHSSRSRREQAGMGGAPAAVLAELAVANEAYEERFGHIYLVCANGRSAGELLGILNQRLRNGPDEERDVVRGELRAINALRLTSLIGPAAGPGPAA
jgi:2-oxo-4-hydroxy-4-carboxy-5-ureidoimidazoline decarboxylase